MSQGEVEKPTGLLRCHISRVENGHTVPSADALEKIARALEIPTYRLFTDDVNVKKPNIPPQDIPSRVLNTKQERELQVVARLISRMNDKNRGCCSTWRQKWQTKLKVLIASYNGLRAVGRNRSFARADRKIRVP